QGDAVLSPTKIISLGGVIQHLFVSPDDAWLYFLDTQNRKVGRIDLKEGKLDGTSDVAPDTTGLCLTPNGNTLYTCSRSNQVQQLSATTLKVQKTFTISKGNPLGIQATDNGHVFLNSGERQWTKVYLLNANRDPIPARPAEVVPWASVYQLSDIRLAPDQK